MRKWSPCTRFPKCKACGCMFMQVEKEEEICIYCRDDMEDTGSKEVTIDER